MEPPFRTLAKPNSPAGWVYNQAREARDGGMRRWLKIIGAIRILPVRRWSRFRSAGAWWVSSSQLSADRPAWGPPVIMSRRYSVFLRHQGSDQSKQLGGGCQEINLDVNYLPTTRPRCRRWLPQELSPNSALSGSGSVWKALNECIDNRSVATANN